MDETKICTKALTTEKNIKRLFPSLCRLEYAAHVLIAEVQDICCKEK